MTTMEILPSTTLNYQTPDYWCPCCGEPMEVITNVFEALNRVVHTGTCKNAKCDLIGQTLSLTTLDNADTLLTKYKATKKFNPVSGECI